MSNSEIAKLLRTVAASYSIKDEGKFRFQIIAYEKAADSIDNLTLELEDLYKSGKPPAIAGIGKTISAHLEELFTKGKVSHFDWVLSGIPESVFVLMDIPSFGPKKAYRIAKEFSLNNPKTVIDDLEKIANQGKIATLSGFGEKSQADILRAINEFREGKGKTTKMTLPLAFEVSEKITSYLEESKYIEKALPLGSLRRMKPLVGDIDIAVSSNNPGKAIEHFVKYPGLDRVIEKGDISSSILITGGRQIDLIVLPPSSLGSLLQHFTGSKDHNVHLREYSIKKGMSLSEKGIKVKKNGVEKLLKFSSEEEFYNALGMDWVPPEIREDQGEIELAISHKLPKLIELGDIKSDFHIHSSFPIEPSHDMGKNSIEEMADKAIELGYEYMGFSEHNPSISKHTKEQMVDLVKKRNKEIEHKISGKKDIRVFKLLEVDILPNGELATPQEVLDELDFAIVSVHSSFSMSKEDMTKRVIKGLSNKKAKILAHPTGRLLNERAGYELDWELVFDFAKRNNKAIEINAWPTRLDITDSVIKMAVDKGVLMVINSDSHAAWQMDMIKYGVAMARRGWAQKKDILNSYSFENFSKWAKS